ncbi:PilZ domain-containing protein [Vibrio sp.]|uniref:PilZ domain-containing protein n=1 Tax=Vibrio sp. TaxID=678 RepID=UPI003D14A6DC
MNQSVSDLLELLKPSTRLSVELEFGPQDIFSFTTQYIGYKENGFMIIDLPLKAKESLLMRKLNNVFIVVRGITDSHFGHIVAFKTSVICQTSTPSSMLFLRLPQHFASKPIREHQRYKLNLPITLTCNTVTFPATLVDISISGCALYISGENELTMESKIEIESDIDQYLPDDIQFHIVSIGKQKKGHKLGIKFDRSIEMNDQLKSALLTYMLDSSNL